MFTWLSVNLINIVLILVIALVVTLIVRGMIRDRRSGKSACGGNCGKILQSPHRAGSPAGSRDNAGGRFT